MMARATRRLSSSARGGSAAPRRADEGCSAVRAAGGAAACSVALREAASAICMRPDISIHSAQRSIPLAAATTSTKSSRGVCPASIASTSLNARARYASGPARSSAKCVPPVPGRCRGVRAHCSSPSCRAGRAPWR